METLQLLALHDQQQRRDLVEPTVRREGFPEGVRHVHLEGGEGMVVYTRLTKEDADRVIGAQIARFRDLGQDFEWKVYGHDAPSDLRARLVAHGFQPEEPEALLILDLERAPEPLRGPVAHDVRRIVRAEELKAIRRILEEVWGAADPDHLEELRRALVKDADRTSIYLAYAGGLPVAYARISFHEGSSFAGLWGGSTLEEYRGMGFYTALLAVRAQEASRRGVRFLTIDASPMSRPIVEKLGFRFLTTTQPFKYRFGGGRRKSGVERDGS